jgi:serine/threonine-protein kinase Chk2
MTDTDLIARIYRVRDNEAGRRLFQDNLNRFRPGVPLSSPSDFGDTGSQSWLSPPPELAGNDDDQDCLELRFSNGPRTHRGFVFGRDVKCDVVFSDQLRRTSIYQFAITFEHDFEDHAGYRLVLRDLKSRAGTGVTYVDRNDDYRYDNSHVKRRRGFRWILSGHPSVCNKAVILHVQHCFQLRIVVFLPQILSEALLDRIKHFLRPRSPRLLFADLDLSSPPKTDAPTAIHSPKSAPILLNMKELGQGSFAVAHHSWNVSTGRIFARKTPLAELTHDQREEWRREARVLSQLDHVREIVFVFSCSLSLLFCLRVFTKIPSSNTLFVFSNSTRRQAATLNSIWNQS